MEGEWEPKFDQSSQMICLIKMGARADSRLIYLIPMRRGTEVVNFVTILRWKIFRYGVLYSQVLFHSSLQLLPHFQVVVIKS